MNQTKNPIIDAINYEVLAKAMEDQNITVEQLAKRTLIAEGTVKNIVTGKTTHSSAQNVYAICKELGVPIEEVLGYSVKTALEVKGAKENDVSILALKEIYESQRAEMKEVNEAHIANIRAHYEQHREDVKEHYEKRLADKREIIEILKEENAKLNIKLQEQEKETKTGNLIRNIIIAAFVLGVIVLLVFEFIHPEHGWIRW
jgi:transcriptional regulator with XRE-family HTH domain